MLTLKRFKALTDSYGAKLQRWPDDVRPAAERLLQTSAEARRLLAEAEALDTAIRAASLRADAGLWGAPGERDAALGRLRAGVSARVAGQPASRSCTGRWTALRTIRQRWRAPLNFGAFGLAAGGGVAVVAGLLIGSAYPAQPDTPSALSMLEPLYIPSAAE